jgi:hypothetical protein
MGGPFYGCGGVYAGKGQVRKLKLKQNSNLLSN